MGGLDELVVGALIEWRVGKWQEGTEERKVEGPGRKCEGECGQIEERKEA